MTSSLATQLAANLRALRDERGVSQERLGQEIGRHRTYIGRLEKARENPSLLAVERLAALLGVTAIELLDGDIARGRELESVAPDVDRRAAADGGDPGDHLPTARRRKPTS